MSVAVRNHFKLFFSFSMKPHTNNADLKFENLALHAACKQAAPSSYTASIPHQQLSIVYPSIHPSVHAYMNTKSCSYRTLCFCQFYIRSSLLLVWYFTIFVVIVVLFDFVCLQKSGGPLLQHLESTSKIKNRERVCTFQNPQATNAFHFISPLLLLLYLKFRGVDDDDGDGDDELLGRWRWGWMDGWMAEPNGSLNIFWLTNWQPARLTNGWWCDRSHVYKQELKKKYSQNTKALFCTFVPKCVCVFSKCWNVFWVLDVTIFLSILFWRANSSFLFCLCGCVCVQTFS